MEYKISGEILVHASKKINKEAQRNNLDSARFITGAIIGEVTLYDVKVYGSKNSFLKDKNKHLAASNFKDYHYGFLVKKSQEI